MTSSGRDHTGARYVEGAPIGVRIREEGDALVATLTMESLAQLAHEEARGRRVRVRFELAAEAFDVDEGSEP